MASTAALIAAVCVVLLHSSMVLPTPAPDCPDYNGQQPAPEPTPAPAVDCPSYCSSECSSNCTAQMGAALTMCDTNYATNFNGCYGSCTARTCPGKSCVQSGCGVGNCTCDNTRARGCCRECSDILSTSYFQCRYLNERGQYDCMVSCLNDCNEKCTQG